MGLGFCGDISDSSALSFYNDQNSLYDRKDRNQDSGDAEGEHG
jgi:hypothetical protein